MREPEQNNVPSPSGGGLGWGQTGEDANSPHPSPLPKGEGTGFTPYTVRDPARERITIPRNGMQPWSAYIIESPDILSVEAINLVPKAPYKLRVFDIVVVNVIGTLPDDPTGTFSVEPGGVIQLGSVYGSVKVGGMSTDEVQEAITKRLNEKLGDKVTVTVTLTRMGDMQQIAGDHTVSPDGRITLGAYGQVRVSGLTIPECKKAIETHLSQFLDNPQVAVDMFSYNSKQYYIVLKVNEFGDRVMMFNCTGNDTVMQAIANMHGLNVNPAQLIQFTLKHVRPRENGEPMVTSLDWEKVLFSPSGFGDNLQLFPGDRLVLEMKE